MDREWLERELGAGRSVEAMARDAQCEPATVAYWINKHRLPRLDAGARPARPRIEEAQLRALVERGLSIRQIAAEVGVSPTAIRHWLRRYGLQTEPAHYSRRNGPKPRELLRDCRVHGWTLFRRVGREGVYRCALCGPARVARRRRRVKSILVAEAGGACQLCGYDRYAGALQFHHVAPSDKRFQLGESGLTRALAALREEAEKCVLLCANCHAEVEGGLLALPADTAREQFIIGPG